MTELNPDSARGADVLAIQYNRLPDRRMPRGFLRVSPDLVVEVLSPHDRWTEVLDKVLEYLRSGVTEVWVVDPEQRTVEAHRAEEAPLHFDDEEMITRPDLLPGFTCRVAEFFADI